MNNQIDNIKSKTIKKFAQQCTTYHKVDFGMYEESGVDLEKFAELIVKECLNITYFRTSDDMADDALEEVRDRIKEHFGVK